MLSQAPGRYLVSGATAGRAPAGASIKRAGIRRDDHIAPVSGAITERAGGGFTR